jgi:hypothetical protein
MRDASSLAGQMQKKVMLTAIHKINRVINPAHVFTEEALTITLQMRNTFSQTLPFM